MRASEVDFIFQLDDEIFHRFDIGYILPRITHFIRGDSAPTPKPSRLRLTLAPPWTRIVQTSGASDTMARYRGVQPVRQCAEL